MINLQIGAIKDEWTGAYTIDCSIVPSLPNITFQFGGKPFTLKGTDYIMDLGEGGGGSCLSPFMGMDLPGDMWIVGDVFLRKFYTIYDLGRDAVGFAESVRY